MSEFEIRIPARKKQPVTDKNNPVVKVSATHTTHWLKSITNQPYQ